MTESATATIEHEATKGAKQAEDLANWQALLAGFAMEQDLHPDDVLEHVSRMPKQHRRCFQLALKGAGNATPAFYPDGDVGRETDGSVWNQYEATGSPSGTS
jgi:hypothetical protein